MAMRDDGLAALEMAEIASSDPLHAVASSNRQIARTLVVSRRAEAAHVEHILAKLRAPTRTHAGVRAERAGLYVPPRAEEGQPP
jgi:hypothetical protein